MKITVYSTSTCPYCKMLKDYLNEMNIAFEDLFVDQDDEAKNKMMEESGGFLGVPFVVIEKDDGSKETVVGFDKNRIDNLINK